MTDDTTTETTEVVDTSSTTEAPAESQSKGDISDAPPRDTEAPDGPEPQSKREARYRTQLREAEAERDELRQAVETMQRNEVERIAAEHITKPAALWTAGTELSSLLTEDGTVDSARVAAAAAEARQQLGLEHPQAKRQRGPVVPREGMSYGRATTGSTWENAFK
ncbi:hypothetical protein [Mycobacterium sp. P7213]|uniref:hypothetical protein n=1 Tax=Mycobacterium sp. P7213 TaxID=2478465 RepID=UPI000F6289F2|nr:hypothetical protein [Mycobacterium sp. P7213]